MESQSPLNMRRAEAARYILENHGIPCSPATLAKYACIGGGPAFRKAGKFPIYSREDLDAWAKRRLGKLMRSTSDLIDQDSIAADPREREQLGRPL
jgi:hypothetical protein